MTEVHSDLRGAWRVRTMALALVPNSVLLLVLCGVSGSKPSWTDVSMEPCTEGDLEALPVNETSGSDVENTISYSIQYGFLADRGLFVPAACMIAAHSSVLHAFVVDAFLPCGPALS